MNVVSCGKLDFVWFQFGNILLFVSPFLVTSSLVGSLDTQATVREEGGGQNTQNCHAVDLLERFSK